MGVRPAAQDSNIGYVFPNCKDVRFLAYLSRSGQSPPGPRSVLERLTVHRLDVQEKCSNTVEDKARLIGWIRWGLSCANDLLFRMELNDSKTLIELLIMRSDISVRCAAR